MKIPIFLNLFFDFWSPVSRIVPKFVKHVPLGVFEHPLICKTKKMKGTLWRQYKIL